MLEKQIPAIVSETIDPAPTTVSRRSLVFGGVGLLLAGSSFATTLSARDYLCHRSLPPDEKR